MFGRCSEACRGLAQNMLSFMLQQYFRFHFNVNIPIFHSHGKYQKHHQPLSLSSTYSAFPSRISYSHLSTSVTICYPHRVSMCLCVPTRLVPFSATGALLSPTCGISRNFPRPAQGSPYLIQPGKVGYLAVRTAASFCFLRMASVGTVFICPVIFFTGLS